MKRCQQVEKRVGLVGIKTKFLGMNLQFFNNLDECRLSDMENYTRLVIFVALFCSSIQSDLPTNFQKCKRSGDDFNGCLKAAIQDALPKCENGIPDLGIPTLEPLRVPEATVGEGATGAVKVIQHYTDIKYYNFSRTKLDKVEAGITDKEFSLLVAGTMKEFIWDSDYDFNGQILVLPISGKGQCFATGSSVNLSIHLIGEIYEKKGEKYIKINTVTVDFNPDDFRIELKNLFNGDERLGAEMNKILNSNWKELWADTKPNYDSLFSTVALDYVNRFFGKVPLNNIFPM